MKIPERLFGGYTGRIELFMKEESFYSNTPNNEKDRLLIVAKVLAEKRAPVWLTDATDRYGNSLSPWMVAIHADPNAKGLLNKILDNPELSNPSNPANYPGRGEESYWAALADKSWKNGDYLAAVRFDIRAIGVRKIGEMVAYGELSSSEISAQYPVEPAELRDLVEQIADRELSSIK